jgi:uncharacterized protein (TIGR02996 family)
VSSRQAFLEAIAADLDDDAPRLLFADWLEEHGDPRGEFIRVQCALAGLPADDPRRTDLARREEKRDVPAHLRERLRTEFGSA